MIITYSRCTYTCCLVTTLQVGIVVPKKKKIVTKWSSHTLDACMQIDFFWWQTVRIMHSCWGPEQTKFQVSTKWIIKYCSQMNGHCYHTASYVVSADQWKAWELNQATSNNKSKVCWQSLNLFRCVKLVPKLSEQSIKSLNFIPVSF